MDIEEFALKLSIFHDEVKAVVESTGNLWIQIHDRLEEHGKDPRGKTLGGSLQEKIFCSS